MESSNRANEASDAEGCPSGFESNTIPKGWPLHLDDKFFPELLTVKDFMRAFRMGRTSFYREVSEGRLRIVKIGRATRITRVDAEAWMAALPEVRRPARLSTTMRG